MINNMDGRAAFEHFCRQPGTRCNEIMTLIEHGYSNRVIADMFGTSANTISVYRKAYEGKLCQILMDTTTWHKSMMHDENKRMIYELHDQGMKPVKIAAELNVSIDSVRHALKSAKKKAVHD